MTGVLPLSTLCVNILLQNHLLLSDLGDVRYPLIKKVLLKLSSQQLTNLESKNPMLLFEDDEIWEKLIIKEFPQELNEHFTTNKSKIWKFYEYQLSEFKFDFKKIDIGHYINLKNQVANGNRIKYRLPSKLVYLKLTKDYQDKKELAIENLRQRMQDIEKSKEKNKVIHLNEVIPVENTYHRRFNNSSNSSSLQNRSKLFQKSHHEAKRHLDFFKNPMNNERIIHKQSSPSPSFALTNPPVISTSSSNNNPIRPVSPLKPVSPVKRPPKQVSIFVQRKPPTKRKKLQTSSNSTPTNTNTKPQNQNSNGNNDNHTAQLEPSKKVKLGEYLARNR